MTLEGNPWFVGMDICEVLGLSSPGYAYMRLDDNEKSYVGRTLLGLPAGKNLVLISESGLYKLIMRSDKPNAKGFQDWVTKEVLPSIRKTGSFVTGQPSLQENPPSYSPKVKIKRCPESVPVPVPRVPVDTNWKGPERLSLQLNTPLPSRLVT